MDPLRQLESQLKEIERRPFEQLIQKVQHELSSLGLDPNFLKSNLARSNTIETIPNDALPPFSSCESESSAVSGSVQWSNSSIVEYRLGGSCIDPVPKLLIAVEEGHPCVSFSNGITSAACSSICASVPGSPAMSSISPNNDSKPETSSTGRVYQQPCSCVESPSPGYLESQVTRASRSVSLEHKPGETSRPYIHLDLEADADFFAALTTAFRSLAVVQSTFSDAFQNAMEDLCRQISMLSGVMTIAPTGFSPVHRSRREKLVCDLYTWRKVISLWVESQIFYSTNERDRRDRSADEASERLAMFSAMVASQGLYSFATDAGRTAGRQFVRLNSTLARLLQFHEDNSKIIATVLAQHDHSTGLRAALAFPTLILTCNYPQSTSSQLDPQFCNKWPLYKLNVSRSLLMQLTETLLPIVPTVDDYLCAICQDIAFKPIRLKCMHLFCVRCLVKMQKRGQNECPFCRALVVLHANAGNVDHALLQFMKTWFPREAKIKQKANEEESLQETIEEFGTDLRCFIM